MIDKDETTKLHERTGAFVTAWSYRHHGAYDSLGLAVALLRAL